MRKIGNLIRHFLHIIAVLIVPKAIKKNMTSCEEYAYLIANNDQNSPMTKFQIKIHNMMCQTCYDYEKQIELINKKAHELGKIQLTAEQKRKLNSSKEDILKKYGS